MVVTGAVNLKTLYMVIHTGLIIHELYTENITGRSTIIFMGEESEAVTRLSDRGTSRETITRRFCFISMI